VHDAGQRIALGLRRPELLDASTISTLFDAAVLQLIRDAQSEFGTLVLVDKI
jgi:hypothetical protein